MCSCPFFWKPNDRYTAYKIHFKYFSSLVSQSVQSLSHVRLFAPHGLQHIRPPCPSPTPGAYSSMCPSSRWCHSTILSSVILFSSCLQPLLSSGSFQMSQFFASGGQSIGASASAAVLPMKEGKSQEKQSSIHYNLWYICGENFTFNNFYNIFTS